MSFFIPAVVMGSRPLFRAPFGARNNPVLTVVYALGYRSIYWSVDSLDSVGSAKSSSFITAVAVSQRDQEPDGAIIFRDWIRGTSFLPN